MDIGAVVKQAVAEINETFPETSLKYDGSTKLMDSGANVDSLALVSLFISIEGKIEAEAGKKITLVNEDSFSRAESPFRDIASLQTYIDELLSE